MSFRRAVAVGKDIMAKLFERPGYTHALVVFFAIASLLGLAFLFLSSTIVAWSSAFLCSIAAATVAIKFLNRNVRLFTVMALFSFSWTLLLPYWAEPAISPQVELNPVYAGFLSVYIGSLLMLHRQLHDGHNAPRKIVPWQVVALWLLLAVAAPSTPGGSKFLGLDAIQFTMLIDIILGILGFVSVSIGVWKCFGPRAGSLIGITLLFYGIIGVTYDAQRWFNPASLSVPIQHLYAYLFSLVKLCYAIFFIAIVAHEGMPEEDRKEGPVHWIFVLAGVQPLMGDSDNPGASSASSETVKPNVKNLTPEDVV
jgi:hypothetical protein